MSSKAGKPEALNTSDCSSAAHSHTRYTQRTRGRLWQVSSSGTLQENKRLGLCLTPRKEKLGIRLPAAETPRCQTQFSLNQSPFTCHLGYSGTPRKP